MATIFPLALKAGLKSVSKTFIFDKTCPRPETLTQALSAPGRKMNQLQPYYGFFFSRIILFLDRKYDSIF